MNSLIKTIFIFTNAIFLCRSSLLPTRSSSRRLLLHLLCPSVAAPTASGLFPFELFGLCFCRRRVKRKGRNHQTGHFDVCRCQSEEIGAPWFEGRCGQSRGGRQETLEIIIYSNQRGRSYSNTHVSPSKVISNAWCCRQEQHTNTSDRTHCGPMTTQIGSLALISCSEASAGCRSAARLDGKLHSEFTADWKTQT